jgi:hypothetical protein
MSAGAVPASALPFPKAGITVSFLEEFVLQHGGRTRFDGLNTTQVCEQILKPVTFTTQASYCEYMETQNHPKVGLATVFVSHAWLFKFLDVVNALQYHFRHSMETIVWFDLFSNNQHQAVNLDFDWWCGTFMSAIREFGNTLMILAPASDPIPLTRGWCIFELYCTIETNSNFQVAMCDEHLTMFFKELEEDEEKTIDKMLATINARNSKCFKPEDKEKIFAAIERTVGFNRINTMIFDRLMDWVVKVMEMEVVSRRAKLCQHQVPEAAVMVYVNILAGLHKNQGKYGSAEPLYVECLDRRKTILGADHPDTLVFASNLEYLRGRRWSRKYILIFYRLYDFLFNESWKKQLMQQLKIVTEYFQKNIELPLKGIPSKKMREKNQESSG